jgi:hypothetical protein
MCGASGLIAGAEASTNLTEDPLLALGEVTLVALDFMIGWPCAQVPGTMSSLEAERASARNGLCTQIPTLLLVNDEPVASGIAREGHVQLAVVAKANKIAVRITKADEGMAAGIAMALVLL